MTDLKVVRLSSGEELIAKVETVNGAYYNLTDVAYLVPTGDSNLGLAPFMGYCDMSEGVVIEPKDVMFIVPPIKGLAEQYGKMFKQSTIDLPEAKKIII
jgi:hypothetical protein